MRTFLASTLAFTALTTATAHTLTLINQCSYDVWPAGGIGDATSNIPNNGGFHLGAGQQQSVTLSDSWNGRWWARTDCTFDASGSGKCLTGDCGGNIGCQNYGATPTTLAEFNLNGNSAYYDISMVDGFNIPMSIVPSGSGCTTPIVDQDINAECPKALSMYDSTGSDVIACMSACTAFGDAADCCTGQYNSQDTCQPSSYSKWFKNIAPTAYSYAWDSGTYFCGSSDFDVVFCPSGSGSSAGSVDKSSDNEAVAGGAATAPEVASGTTTTAPTSTATAAPAVAPQTSNRANVQLFSTQDSTCTGTPADNISQIIADGQTCHQTSSLQYITVSCTSGTAELKAFDTSDCSGGAGLIIDTPLSQCQSNGDGTVTDGQATAHIITCAQGTAPDIPAQAATTSAPVTTLAPTQAATVTVHAATSSGSIEGVSPAALGHASISSWTNSDSTCSGSSADSLANIVADGTSCYPTSALGWITIQCANGAATLSSFTNNACTGSAALTQQFTPDACDVTSVLSATAVAIHCGSASDDVSVIPQQTYTQSTNAATASAIPVSTATPVNTGLTAPSEFLLTGLVFRPSVVANKDGSRSVLFSVNKTATPLDVQSSLSYIIAHYQIDQSYQQNIYQTTGKQVNGTFTFPLAQSPKQSLWYTFTVGDSHGTQLDTAVNSVNQTTLASLYATSTPFPNPQTYKKH